ncbi:MAG: chloride channel protein [Methanomassiliicoccus sp.]|nr:chloride channel protein [Methanomassiliicoccus sp.]
MESCRTKGGKVTEEGGPREIDIRSRPYYMLLLLSGAMGIAGALITVAFFIVLRIGTQLLWNDLPGVLGLGAGTSSAPFIIAACLIGGLLVGLITQYTKVRPALLAEELVEFVDSGRITPRNGFVGMIRGLVGLMFGGSIGPEGPLTGGCGAMGTWTADRLKVKKPASAVFTLAGISGMFGSFLGSPFGFAVLTIEGGLEKGKLSWKLLLPSIVAASVGYTVFFAITGYVFGGNYQFPPYEGWNLIDLGYAVGLGLLGGLLGMAFIRLFRVMRRWGGRWRSRPIASSLLAGLILGSVGALFPVLLFSGDAQIQTLIDQAAVLGFVVLMALALLKIFLTVTCLSLGWSGGYLFPAFFIGSSMGLAMHQLLPFIPEVVCIVCVMSGVSVALLKSPIALALIVQTLFDVQLAPVIAISILTAFLLTYRTDLLPPDDVAAEAPEPAGTRSGQTG